MLRGL